MAYKIMKKNKINKESKNVETTGDKGVNSTDLLDIISLIKKLQQSISVASEHIMELKQLIYHQLPNQGSIRQSGEIVQSVLSSDGIWRSQRLWPPEKERFVLKALRWLFRLRP